MILGFLLFPQEYYTSEWILWSLIFYQTLQYWNDVTKRYVYVEAWKSVHPLYILLYDIIISFYDISFFF